MIALLERHFGIETVEHLFLFIFFSTPVLGLLVLLVLLFRSNSLRIVIQFSWRKLILFLKLILSKRPPGV
jgi:pilus assembly protein TadC